MSRIFPVRQTEETDASGADHPRWDIPTGAIELIEAIITRFGLDMRSFLDAQIREFLSDGDWPWAVIFFDAEFPLSGHVAQLRGVKRNMMMFSYSWAKKDRPPIVPGDIPPVSVITVRRKAILKHVAERSPLFAPAWDILKDKSEDRQWFCVSDSPPAKWVEATSVGDEELFLKCRRNVDVVYRNPVCLKDPAVRDAYVLSALAHCSNDWNDASLNSLCSVIESEPNMPEAWHLLGNALLFLEKYDGAIHALTKAHKMEPCWIPTLGNLALAYGGKKRYGRGLALLRQILDINPFDENAWGHSARMYREAGRKKQAIEAYRKYLELNHGDVGGWRHFYNLLHETGQTAEAVEMCEKVTHLVPDDAMAWNDLGFLLATVGRCEEAVTVCNKARKLNPTCVHAWDSLGYADLIAGRYDKAITSLMKALEIKSDHAPAWRHLLHAYKMSGQEEQFAAARTYVLGILPAEVATVDAELVSGQIS